MVSLVLLVISGGEDVKMLVGVFAIAAFRLLPAMKNILTSWTQVQNSAYCLDVIEAGLSDDKSGVDREELCITFEKEISKLERLNPQSPDYSVQFGYLQTILELPWNEYTRLNSKIYQYNSVIHRILMRY